MHSKHEITEEEQEEYILLDRNPPHTSGTDYKRLHGWETGTKLTRVSKWLSGNGCGVKQAYFIKDNEYPQIVWEDDVKPFIGQIELEI